MFPRQVVFTRTVNMPTITYPVTALTFDGTGTGVYTDVKVGQTVLVYDSTGATLKGILRVAYGAASSTVLQVNEFSHGTLHLADNDIFSVIYEFGIWDMLVSATQAFNKDSRITYSDQNSNPPPVCNSGGPFVGFVDRVTGYYAHDFDGTTSFTVDPDSSGTLTHAWTFPGATPSSSAIANPTNILFPASESAYLCTHTVTDSSNSKTQTQYITGRVYSDTIRPLSVAMTSLDGSVDEGDYTAVFEVPSASQADISVLPDGCFVIYWEVENRAGVLSTAIKFTGYLDSESVTIGAGDSTVEFTAIGPLALLAKTGALPQILTNTTSPANWLQMKTLTFWRMLWYCLYWGSTAMLSHDFIWPDGTDKAYYSLSVDNQDSIAGQLKDLASSLQVKVTADRLGRIRLTREVAYLTEAQRATRTTSYNLTTADVVEANLTREHRRQIKAVSGEGLVAGATLDALKAVYSLAPGTAPGPGTGSDTLSRCVVDSQSELNIWTGEHLAKLNGTYWDESTNAIRIVPIDVTLKLPPQYDLFDFAYLEPVTYTLASTTNKRGLVFTASERWIINGLSLSYDPETGDKSLELKVSHETHGPVGLTDIRPSQSGTTTPPPSDDVTTPGTGITTPPTLYPYGWLPGANTLAVFTPTGVWITSNFNTPSSAGGPTWTFTTLAYGGGQSARSFVVDALSPKYLGTGTAVNGWVRSATHIYRVTDIFGSIAVSSEVIFVSAQANWAIDFTYGAGGAGLWGVSAWRATNQTYASYTTNGGAAWSAEAPITVNTMTLSLDTGLVISANTGNGYASAVNGSGASDIYKIDPIGLTWASFLAVGSTNSIGAIAVPFFNNTADTYLYYHKRTSTSTTNGDHLMRYDGSTQTDISPVVSGTNYCPLVNESINQSSRWKMSFPSNSRTKMLLVAQSSNGIGPSAVFATANAEDAAPTWVTVIAPGSSTHRFGVLADDGQSAYLWGGNGGSPKVAYTGNVWDGSGVDDRTGNMVDNAGQGTPLGICGG